MVWPSSSKPSMVASPTGDCSARMRLLRNGVENKRPAARNVARGSSRLPTRKRARTPSSGSDVRTVVLILETDDAMGGLRRTSAWGKGRVRGVRRDPPFDGSIGVATRQVVAEQAGFVMRGEGNRVQLEDVLFDIARGEIARIDRELHGALQFGAPAAFVVQHLVAQGAGAVVVFGDR